MTADQLHGSLIVAAGFLILLGMLGLASLIAVFGQRSHEIDANIAADARRIEHERQRRRAGYAVDRREAAERRMRGAR